MFKIQPGRAWRFRQFGSRGFKVEKFIVCRLDSRLECGMMTDAHTAPHSSIHLQIPPTFLQPSSPENPHGIPSIPSTEHPNYLPPTMLNPPLTRTRILDIRAVYFDTFNSLIFREMDGEFF